MTKHERAIEAAKAAYFERYKKASNHTESLTDAIATYLAVMRQPLLNEVRVRACVCVGENGEWFFAGSHELDTIAEFKEDACPDHCIELPQFHFIEANIPAWRPPVEETVEGEVVE